MQFVPNKCRGITRALQKEKIFNPKVWRMIRWTAILFFIGCLHASATIYSQRVTIRVKDKPLSTVLKSIQEQSGYYFVYPEEWMKLAKPVSAEIKDMPLRTALDICLKGQPFTYSIIEKTIALKLKAIQVKVKPIVNILPRPVLQDIQGLVTDSAGVPMANVSVFVKGTGHGTVTDKYGHFLLTNVDANTATIVFDYVGYKEQQVALNGKQSLSVIMYPSHSELDEMQVIAYGTTTKRFSTGAVVKVSSEKLSNQPVDNPLQALEGQVAGVYINQQTGTPGGAINVMLRGQNSIASGNAPLYVIDGVPYPTSSISSFTVNSAILIGGNPLSNLNTSDIESIEVLKDADATAIYGSRAANGAILITTKKGKSGKTRVNINLYSGASKVTRMMDLLNTNQYLQMRHEAFINDGVAPNATNARDLFLWDTTQYTNWQKQLIGGTAGTTNGQISISGGTENTQFILGGQYLHQGTVFPGNFRDQKGSAYFNITNQSTNKRFKAQLSGSFVSDNNLLPSQDITFRSLILAPDAPQMIDSTGKLTWTTGLINPYRYLWSHYSVLTTTLLSNAMLSYQLTKSLYVKLSGGYTQMNSNETSKTPISTLNPASINPTGRTQFATGVLRTWIIEPQLQYAKRINNSKFELLIGGTFQQDINSSNTLYATGYTSDAQLDDIAAASTITTQNASYSLYRYNALFGRINYIWNDEILLNLTGRRDGSSRFGPGKQFANFGAVGAGWIFSDTRFFKENLQIISFAKIRASYGITGNDQIGDYQYLNTYSSTQYPYQNAPGLFPTSLYNANYGWETNKKLEIGLDLGFVKDRFLASIDYYRNKSSNQLVGYPLPYITGENSIQANLPALVENYGWELTLQLTNIKAKNFDWTTSFNLTFPRNKLVSYPEIVNSSYANVYTVGKSLFTKKLFHYLIVDPQTGVYQFLDVNHDNQISYPNDLIAVKQVSQNYFGGLQNNFSYKGLQLSFLLQFVKQTGNNYLKQGFFGAPGRLGNQPTLVLNRWQKPGDKTNIQMFSQGLTTAYTAYSNSINYSDNTIGDASFIRFKNVSLSYQLPRNTISRMHLQGLQIYIHAQNLITITKYVGLDPETQRTENLPPLKTIVAGFQLTF